MPILISHVFSWKTKFRNTDVDITFLFPRCKIVTNKTSKVFIGIIPTPTLMNPTTPNY